MLNIKILVVDDDPNICEILRLYLQKEGYDVIVAHDGGKALEIFKEETPSLVLLDLMLPVLDGRQVCGEMRRMSNIPIIMITAKGETFDKVLGLELGADDYIVKPFENKEVVARIKAVLRRYNTKESNKSEIVFPNLYINMSTYELKLSGNLMEVPPKELELLFYLCSNPNQVFTREQLLKQVWGFDYYGDSRTVDVHVKRLREKLEDHKKNWQLKTVWGVGYKFEVH